jgi:hypothetical protein
MGGPAWQALTSLPAWEITEIPRHNGPRSADWPDGGSRDLGVSQRGQALAAACRAGAPVAFGWVRARAGGPVRVIAAGPGLTAADDAGQAVLTVPAGARGELLPDGGAGTAFGAVGCWVPVAVVADALLADPEAAGHGRDGPGQAAPSLEEGLLGSWPWPFGWLAVAEPAGDGELGEMISQAAMAQLGAQRHDSPRAQLAARRAAARHAELRRAAAAGLWRIRLLAGGESSQAAGQVAGLLCASADLGGLPYALVPTGECGPLGEVLDGGLPAGRAVAAVPALAADGRYADPVPEFPCWGSSRLLAALARPPAREVPGIRFTLRPDFDVTPETGAGGVALGEVLDWNRVPAGTLTIPRASLNRHVFVAGATGAGKSQTIRHLLESASEAGIPWLVVEPAKAEYRLMAARLPGAEVVAIRPGELDVPPAGLNPLEPAAGPDGARFSLQAHADLVRALFLAAFEADEPFPQVLAAALTRCYAESGWDLVTGQPTVDGAAYPSLADLQAAAMAVVEEIGYGREVTDNVRGFVRVRIGSLRLGTAGRFLDGGFPLDFARLMGSNVVLEIEDCGDDTDKAFLTGAVLIRLTEHLRMRSRSEGPLPPGLRHLTVVEEAHRLLRQPTPGTGFGPAAHAVEMFAGLLAEVRAYGEGLVIAEQIPVKLIPDVVKNTAVKVVHRLPALDDRQTVGATMNLTEEQSRYLVTLVPGEAAVFADGMDYPLLARMPDGTVREASGGECAVSPAALITVRSAACPPPCGRAPCTLRQIRAVQRLAAAEPRLALWAELSVLAHLTGWAMPMPGPLWADELSATGARLRDCALAHAVDDAAMARVPVIAARVSGPALAAHVTAAMRAALDEDRWACSTREPKWLAPSCQWTALLGELRAWDRDHPGSGPHPRTQERQALYARAIPGSTCAEQVAVVQRWHAAAQRDQQTLRNVAFGTRAPSVIEQAVGAGAADPDWEQRLTAALADFPDCGWAHGLLTLAAEAPS